VVITYRVVEALTELAEEWELTLGEVSPETRVVYLRSVRQLAEWLTREHPGLTGPGEVTTRHVHMWQRALADAGRSKGTRRVRLIAVRLFFGYLASEPDTGVETNPAAGIELPEADQRPVPVIHDDDLVRLLRAMDGPTFVDRRDTAMVRVLLDTGCRRAELAGIDVDDLDLRAQEIMLRRAKGGRPRVVPIGSRTALALRKYLRARAKHAAAGSPPLFLSTRAGTVGGSRISGGGVAEMLGRRCAAVGLPPINPHRFRHTWAHDLLANGANEGDVEKLAGWRSPTMVRRYGASAADQRARDAARQLGRGDRV
jgi:integrase